MTLDVCVNKVQRDQDAYCRAKVNPTIQMANQQKSQCGQARKECSGAQARLKNLSKEKDLLVAKKRTLETELAKVNNELAIKSASVAKAEGDVNKQCGGR